MFSVDIVTLANECIVKPIEINRIDNMCEKPDYKLLLKRVIKSVCECEGVDSDWITHDQWTGESRFTEEEVEIILRLEKEEAE